MSTCVSTSTRVCTPTPVCKGVHFCIGEHTTNTSLRVYVHVYDTFVGEGVLFGDPEDARRTVEEGTFSVTPRTLGQKSRGRNPYPDTSLGSTGGEESLGDWDVPQCA